MTQLTEQELKLQQKYAELRKKKASHLPNLTVRNVQELKRKQAEEAAAAAAKSDGPSQQSGSAHDKAKAILARKAAAAPFQKPASTFTPPTGQMLNPLVAAKQALEENKKGSAASKRPVLKRPTVQRGAAKASPRQDDADASPHSTQTVHPVPAAPRPAKRPSLDEDWRRDRPASSSRTNWEDNSHPHKRPRYEEGSSARPIQQDTECTVFVGDLPPYYKNEDLYHVFAQWGEIDEVRVMGTQCYAFVRFSRPEVAQHIVQHFAQKPLTASGHELRINLAHGQLPDWKRTPGYDSGRAPRGQVHPRVLQAQHHGDALAQQLLAAGSHGLDFTAKPCERDLVSYDDL